MKANTCSLLGTRIQREIGCAKQILAGRHANRSKETPPLSSLHQSTPCRISPSTGHKIPSLSGDPLPYPCHSDRRQFSCEVLSTPMTDQLSCQLGTRSRRGDVRVRVMGVRWLKLSEVQCRRMNRQSFKETRPTRHSFVKVE